MSDSSLLISAGENCCSRSCRAGPENNNEEPASRNSVSLQPGKLNPLNRVREVRALRYTELVNIAFRIAWITFLAFSLLLPGTGVPLRSGSQPSGTQSSSTSGTKKASDRPAPSAEEIADAKSKGLVWVNLSTHVYHKQGPLYGRTKRGKFMTEEDAKKAGYRLAKEDESPKKTSTRSNPK
jgi:hypothetical protein